MDTFEICSHKVYVEFPANGLQKSGNPAVLLNDGEWIPRLHLRSRRAVLFGITPDDRLSEYTPWPEKAIRPGAPDFGGKLKQYHDQLLSEILPFLEDEYVLDHMKLAYGGFSLGGLAAVMSLWQTDRFRFVFSLCGSFWYPGAVDYMAGTAPCSRSAHVFLLNGEKEGQGHTNQLQNADDYARQAHRTLASYLNVTSVIDEYAHHERQAERFQMALDWVDQKISPQ